jgi:hypothetical protein
VISKREEEEARQEAIRQEAEARASLLAESDEPTIEVGGVPVPLSMAAAAVGRCIRAIQVVDALLVQGFAGEDDLRKLRASLTGEDTDQNVAEADGTIK